MEGEPSGAVGVCVKRRVWKKMDIDGPVALQEVLSIPGSMELCQAWWKGACRGPDLVPCPEGREPVPDVPLTGLL